MALVSITNLAYGYPEVPSLALDGISLEVEAGEWVLLQGATGSGKSTLLKCISGACPSFYGGSMSGKVMVSGTPVAKMTPKMRVETMGFVGQDPEAGAVYDVVEREVAFALENLGVRPTDMRWRVAEALELVGLSQAAQHRVATLSGGQRQRLALAGALVHQPQLLLLDEPTSQLDPVSSNELFDLLKRLQQEYGVTILMSEHRLDAAYLYADRVVVLDKGRTLFAGSPREAAAHLRHTRVTQVPTLARLFPDGENPCLSVREVREVLANRIPGSASPTKNVETSGVRREAQSATDGDTLGETQRASQREAHEARQADSQPIVELRGVTTFYPGTDHPALNDCTVSIPAGGITVVVGPNGSGKSTLLRILAGLQKVHTGRVRWATTESGQTRLRRGLFAGRGRNPQTQGDASHAVEVAYLPQKPSDLFSQLTVEEELRYGLKMRGLKDEDIAIRLDKATNQFALRQLLNRSPRDVSGGEQLRVALASLLVTNPSLLLLDEPTRGLDTSQKESLGGMLRRMVETTDCAVVLVTHDMEFAAEFASHIVFLHGGSIAMSGTPREVFARALVFSPAVARAFRPFDDDVYRLTDAMARGWTE